ncbi:hypothetical protein MKK50_22495 [Methylobacterium sp. J-043]|uniref:hypothetical protein n=1 Tax=Methylorubrum TaxID=2282523 RepID=UPI00209CBBF8|nr:MULTISPECIES: hypothetical protein [Methylorubrum]MCJ2032139.1 hypothetical protein [Methylobacterium sp. J-043]MCP1551594.1 hypothetical protein [Methylorubrum zatmanii]MCP1556531.1 hypothetical protein [Methylorubrum extorquens]MCP1581808.1 hypothetical protein [Methylorubrum extorquens]
MKSEIPLFAIFVLASTIASGSLAQEPRIPLSEVGTRAQSACKFPSLAERVKLAAVGTYEGEALSTASIGGDDQEVTVSHLEIESGSEPLYLALTSYSANIWLITGAVERIADVVANSQQVGVGKRPRVGVVGVKPERVHFVLEAGCFPYFYEQTSPESGQAVMALKASLGRAPDAVVASYGIASMSVPSGRPNKQIPVSGTVSLPKSGPAKDLWAEMLRFNPAGLVAIAPEAVVSPLPVKRYDVLPQEAGLAQLVEEGVLKVTGSDNGMIFNGGRPEFANKPDNFLIQRKTKFPAGLNGAHSVNFVLGRGVPMPDGDPGHSCVMSEDEGRAVAGRVRC